MKIASRIPEEKQVLDETVSALTPLYEYFGLLDVQQVDGSSATPEQVRELVEFTISELKFRAAALESANIRVEELSQLHEELEAGVTYDDALDCATIDAMEALMNSGIADTSFDGELTFDQNVVISKDDFKPYIRHAIQTWLAVKLNS